jgi:hypothetical protein
VACHSQHYLNIHSPAEEAGGSTKSSEGQSQALKVLSGTEVNSFLPNDEEER